MATPSASRATNSTTRERGRIRRVNATVRFYLGFVLALALVIAGSYYAGYHAAEGHLRAGTRAVHSAP